MKKGFTLVELLGVLITIGVISLVTIPVVSSIIKNSKNKLYDSQVNLIKVAAKKYVLQNIDKEDKVNKNLNTYLSVETLIKSGFLENKDIKDPRDESKLMNGCVTVKYENNKFTYTYSDSTCEKLNTGHEPIINISNHTIKVEINDQNFDISNINVNATTYENQPINIDNPVITKGGKVVDSVDLSILNARYILTYTAVDPSNLLVSKDKVKLIVVDRTPPVITISGIENNRVTVKLGDRYTLPDAAVVDNSGEKIDATITGLADTSAIGQYQITYSAVDSSGNSSSYNLTVEVTQ